jgi:hypothetical protein
MEESSAQVESSIHATPDLGMFIEEYGNLT